MLLVRSFSTTSRPACGRPPQAAARAPQGQCCTWSRPSSGGRDSWAVETGPEQGPIGDRSAQAIPVDRLSVEGSTKSCQGDSRMLDSREAFAQVRQGSTIQLLP